MNDDLQKKISEAIANPQNMGELANADAIGTVGSSDCGEMLRMWVKFKDENGKKVIDRATFQSFGCENRHRRGQFGHRIDPREDRRGSAIVKDRRTRR